PPREPVQQTLGAGRARCPGGRSPSPRGSSGRSSSAPRAPAAEIHIPDRFGAIVTFVRRRRGSRAAEELGDPDPWRSRAPAPRGRGSMRTIARGGTTTAGVLLAVGALGGAIGLPAGAATAQTGAPAGEGATTASAVVPAAGAGSSAAG